MRGSNINGVVYVLDSNLQPKNLIQGYKSLLWVDRFREAGEFEIYISYSKDVLDRIGLNDYIISTNGSTSVMIVEDITLSADFDDGDMIIIKGRSSEILLNRRIVWGHIKLSGALEGQYKKLIETHVTNTSDSNRNIPIMVFATNDNFALKDAQILHEFTGDNIYDITVNLAKKYGFGFHMINDGSRLVLYLLSGVDRSYKQDTLPYVVFSDKNSNLITSKYHADNTKLKNWAKIDGEGEGSSRITETVGDPTITGISRRELYVDARDISRNGENNTPIPEALYRDKLKARGREKLQECKVEILFDGELDSNNKYVYNRDYYLGDIVQIEGKDGIKGRAIVTERVLSHDDSGINIYPSFEIIE